MTDTTKVLAQLNPAATTLTTLYTVPALTSAVVSSLVICNQSATDITFRLSIQIAAAADDPKQYLYYDLPLVANDTFVATIGVTLAASDVIKVYASSTSVSFSAFGVEVT